MQYSFTDISKILKSKIKNKTFDLSIKHFVYDTRKIIFPESSLFFAIKTKRNNGLYYVNDAYNKGVKAFIIENKKFPFSKFPNAQFIVVDNSIKALQQLAVFHRKSFDIPVIGITGSNGKTILKEWLYFLMKDSFNIARSPGSYNSQIGVPLSIFKINKNHDFVIIEAGISQKGEMSLLQKIINPNIGIFTNIGDAHSSGFHNLEEKLNEKLKLFQNSEKIICCADDKKVMMSLIKKYPDKEIISWSINRNNYSSFKISDIHKNKKNAVIHYFWMSKEGRFTIPYKDKVSIRLAVTSFLSALVLGADINNISKKMKMLSYPKMRMEIKRGINDCTLINDSYNSDIESIKNALNYIQNRENNKIKTLILSDILQSGYNDKRLYEIVKKSIEESGINKLILVGKNIRGLKNIIDKKIQSFYFKNTDELLAEIEDIEFKNELILLKGSRKFEFEKLFEKLSQNYHNTVLETDLKALTHNINVYKSYLKPKTKIMAVIKASGYGAGAVKLANHLQNSGVDYFSVAFIDEGIELRNSGITLPVMVFNPDMVFLNEIDKYHLEPVIYSFSQLDMIPLKKSLSIHIKFDTGMKRLGFEDNDISKLIKKLEKFENLNIVSFFSHLAAANDNNSDEFTKNQILKFTKICSTMDDFLGYSPVRHILNSSGIVRFPQYQFDMVRLGAGLHGIDPGNSIQEKLISVHSLKTFISQIKYVKTGESIGYGRKCIKNHERIIAIIPVGYADGLLRQAGNGNYKVWIDGNFVPVIADVNMDMSFLDITGLPWIKKNDRVEIFGEHAKITALAKAGNTIFYEILSRISPRVKRIYID